MNSRAQLSLIFGVLATWLVFVSGSGAAQEQTGWKAGVAKTVITPTESIWMAGFGSRKLPSAGVRQDIFAKALALQDAEGKPAVITTLDLVGIERQMADRIAQECEKRFGLTRDRLVLNVSHTHSGPVAGLVLMPLYDLDPAGRDVVRRYTDELIEKIIGTIGRSLQNLAPASVEFGQGLAGIAVNRRRGPRRSLPGPVDHDVPVLAIRDGGRKLQAVVVGYAAHATALSDYLISGDWPGFAMEEIEKQHAGATALFVQGCGADANPLPRAGEELARSYGKILAAAADEVLRGRMTPLRGPLRSAYELVDVPFHRPPTREELQARLTDKNIYARLHARRLLEELNRDGKLPATYPYPVQIWQFGAGLKFIALGGEVVADYSLRLKNQYGFDGTWVAGYSNDILAYIPSRRVLNEGGYEGGDSMIYFGRPDRFGAAVEEIIVEKVQDLAAKVAP
ncbi:MAG: hypothetical protein RIQ93_1688 [Verrucomicrobiota bacterium]|jgi:hypothetical protein